MSRNRNNPSGNRAPEPCDYHVRTLKYSEQRCAYHANQLITNFCKSPECLLPVCPTCIRLHSEEHKIHRTASQLEEISKVVAEIDGVYARMADLVERVRTLLVDIEGDKKQNESKIRGKLIQHRNILIRQFQQALISIQNQMIETIVSDDRSFIQQIQKIDDELGQVQKRIKQDKAILHSDDILKQIILHYSKRSAEGYQRELDALKARSEDLVKQSIVVTVDEGELTVISKAISRYMNIQITDHRQ